MGFSSLRMTTNNQISPMKFCCNTSFTLPKLSKDLDLSYKKDLDFWDCFGKKKLFYNRKNMVKHFSMTDIMEGTKTYKGKSNSFVLYLQ